MDATRISGCLFGMALGDALGADTEFIDVPRILQRYPPNGPQAPTGNPALVTDDTQMALAVGEALGAAPLPYTPQSLGPELRRTFVSWYNDPENNRAPGRTCLIACKHLADGTHWIEASQIGSKGCGANMRVMPVGLLAVDEQTRSAIAQFQAAYTHGHPTGLAAADLTAFVIATLAEGIEPTSLMTLAHDYAEQQRSVYHEAWLGDLWTRAHTFDTAQDYIARGWDECLAIPRRVSVALVHVDRYSDPCLATGDGWIAEEALATALLCFLMYPDDPVAVIRRAAVTRGDSDSIACIAGSFAGAHCGVEAWPPDWIERIEYRDRISALSTTLSEQHRQRQ
jgi:ADP-ribosylglycohydrolase